MYQLLFNPYVNDHINLVSIGLYMVAIALIITYLIEKD